MHGHILINVQYPECLGYTGTFENLSLCVKKIKIEIEHTCMCFLLKYKKVLKKRKPRVNIWLLLIQSPKATMNQSCIRYHQILIKTLKIYSRRTYRRTDKG